jgi:hypothetical protein
MVIVRNRDVPDCDIFYCDYVAAFNLLICKVRIVDCTEGWFGAREFMEPSTVCKRLRGISYA